MLIDWITIQLLGEGEVEQWVQSQTVWKNKHPESRRVQITFTIFTPIY